MCLLLWLACAAPDPAEKPDPVDPTGTASDCASGLSYYFDADGDGYGAGEPVVSCSPVEGAVEDASDCDDTLADVHPGAIETCASAYDDDCDGSTDCAGDLGDAYARLLNEERGGAEITWSQGEQELGIHDAVSVWLGGERNVLATLPASGDHGLQSTARATISAFADYGLVDLDRDGETDLVAPWGEDGVAGVDVFPGPLGDVDPDSTHVEDLVVDVGGIVVAYVRSGGDLDGDGADDLVLLASGVASSVYLLSADGSGGADAQEIVHSVAFFGLPAAVGDHDGDGFSDLLVQVGGVTGYVVGGPWEGDAREAQDGIELGYGDIQAHWSPAGDVDADGYDDLLGFDDDGVYLLRGPLVAGDVAGVAWASVARTEDDLVVAGVDAGDVDGDGGTDVLVGTGGTPQGHGAVYVFHGFEEGAYTTTDADACWRGAEPGDVLDGIRVLDDLDSDGAQDVAISAGGEDVEQGVAGVVYVFGALVP